MHSHPVEDVLGSVLNACRVQVGAISDSRREQVRRNETPATCNRHFYLIGGPEALTLGATAADPILLHRDDLVVMLSEMRHSLTPSSESGTHTLHGEFELPVEPATSLLQALPGCLILRSQDASPHFGKLVDILRAVVTDVRPGQQILINNLAGSILALAVFEHAKQGCGSDGLSGLLDVRIARVLRAIHEQPQVNWNIRALASLAGMSRSTFALHFLAVVGMPPMRYVTSWRMEKAKCMLRDQRASVAQVTQLLGYSSEAAFRKLFKRVTGVSPGQTRAQGRALVPLTQ